PEEPEPERPTARWLEPLPGNPARLERVREGASYLAVIRVIGVGGAGLNALDRMIDAGITQVDFVAVNTDIQQLQMSDAPVKVHIGSELTEGLGSGADPEVGKRAAEEAYDQLKRVLRGSDMVFVTAGEGGGTGSGAAPIVARIAREVVRTIMKAAGSALMGIGYATGENRAREAAERALRSPLIDTEILGARGILLSIAGGDDLSLYEVNEAAEAVRAAATDDTNIIFGATIDERLTGQIWITVVATGLGGARRRNLVAVGDRDALAPPSFLAG